jgi:limonene-1,2-epoxide hydrolase
MRRALALGAVLVVAAAGSGASAAAPAARTPAQVVHAWSKALNANHNDAAARLFAPNARVLQGGYELLLKTHVVAVAFNAGLPCSGTIVGIRVHGNSVLATFRLGERPKHRCDAPGRKAAAVFVVRHGKIVLWEQVPVPAPGPTA